MCDHAFILSAALQAHHIRAEVLPPPDDETLQIGLGLCRGRECLPCFTCIGDIIRYARRPGFNPREAAILMPTTAGPCRFGQYKALIADLLEQEGLGEIEILSPTAANSYQGFGDNPIKLRQLAWQGIVAVDLLQKLLHEYRPYEIKPGQTDEIYQACLQRVIEAVRAGGGKPLVEAMKGTAGRFETLPVDRSQSRPLIGLVGEIYLRANPYTNQNIIRQVEAVGGQVLVASMMEWFYFTTWGFKLFTWFFGMYPEFLMSHLVDLFQRYHERKLLKPVEHLLQYPHETPVAKLMDNIRSYYEPVLGTEAVMSMGKAIDLARLNLSGILNVMPFSCMPGIIVAGMAPRIRADLYNIPWLDIIYDAQAGTNLNTRLEAFMYQAVQFQRSVISKSGLHRARV